MEDVGSTKECRQGEIPAEMSRLHDKKEELHDRIGILSDRLQDLLRGQDPKKTGCQPQQPLTSKFAMDLSSVNATLETDIEKVRDILDRLEL